MPIKKRQKPLYQRGAYKLYRRDDRANLEIIYYDPERKRERSVSAGTPDESAGRSELDRLFVQHTGGEAFCPECGQPRTNAGVFASTAIADYLALHSDSDKIGSIRPRLNHVLAYIVARDKLTDRCKDIDAEWIDGFRKWALAQPIVSTKGKVRPRSLSTVENSVLQLQAAINRCGGVTAQFKALQPREVNRTPQYRADVPTIARMFAFCVSPKPVDRNGRQLSPTEYERRKRERQHLLAFLRISVATMARPDAAMEVSTDPAKRQWNSNARVLNLNPHGRRQTKKYRSTVPMARQMATILDATKGNLIPVNSIKSAWNSMSKELQLPEHGESGTKLIRRSMANIVRQRLPQEAWGELEIFLGHSKFDDVSDLYAPFSPDYLRRALAVVESVIEEIEIACPGAFYRDFTADRDRVVRLGSAKK